VNGRSIEHDDLRHDYDHRHDKDAEVDPQIALRALRLLQGLAHQPLPQPSNIPQESLLNRGVVHFLEVDAFKDQVQQADSDSKAKNKAESEVRLGLLATLYRV